MPKCIVCDKETDEKEEYCELHSKAHKNLKRKYEAWKRALNIEWKEYLKQILRNPTTGASAREVAQQLLEKE